MPPNAGDYNPSRLGEIVRIRRGGLGGGGGAAEARPALIEYLKGQETHHAQESFVDELRRMVETAHLTWQADPLP